MRHAASLLGGNLKSSLIQEVLRRTYFLIRIHDAILLSSAVHRCERLACCLLGCSHTRHIHDWYRDHLLLGLPVLALIPRQATVNMLLLPRRSLIGAIERQTYVAISVLNSNILLLLMKLTWCLHDGLLVNVLMRLSLAWSQVGRVKWVEAVAGAIGLRYSYISGASPVLSLLILLLDIIAICVLIWGGIIVIHGAVRVDVNHYNQLSLQLKIVLGKWLWLTSSV